MPFVFLFWHFLTHFLFLFICWPVTGGSTPEIRYFLIYCTSINVPSVTIKKIVRRCSSDKGLSPLPIAFFCAPALSTLSTNGKRFIETCLHSHILCTWSKELRCPYPSLGMVTIYTCYFACFILYVSHVGLCPFGGLVRDLLLRRLKGYLHENALPEEHLASRSERALLAGHQSRGALPTLVGGHHCNRRYVPS